ncbi:hypothetical protein IJ182_05090 [bacterium]|nr:hypothetical protein [bacterium]
MPIEGFDYKALSQSLLSQLAEMLQASSNPAVPDVVTNEDKKFIIEAVKSLCIMSGDALAKQPDSKLNAEQASMIVQCIAEWSFHKSIDMITGKVPTQHRKRILQNVALNIFQTMQNAFKLQKFNTDTIISLVEDKVKQVYLDELQKMVKAGEMTEQQARIAASASNMDVMVQKSQEIVNENKEAEQPKPAPISDSKTYKLVALAIILKNLPEQKAAEILNSLDKNLVPHVINYMKTSNIEEKMDQTLMIKTLEEIKKVIPLPESVTVHKVVQNFHKLLKNTPPQVLSNIALKERESVKDLILDTSFPAMEIFSPLVIKSLVKSLEEKINDN